MARRESIQSTDSLLVKRRRRELFEDPLQHLWAISYSDLLMVLMTFFILFFKFDSLITHASPLDGVILTLKEKGAFQKTGMENRAGASASVATASSLDPSASMAALADKNSKATESQNIMQSNSRPMNAMVKQLEQSKLNFKFIGAGKELLIDFPDDLYGVGQYAVRSSQKKELIKVIALLEPYKNFVSLTFIGHTDETPIYGDHQIINSNLVLSNLRASRAAEFVMLRGFDPNSVATKGVGQYQRHQRTLSLLISERGKQ